MDSSITLSHTARALLHDIVAQLKYRDQLLLCCIKWEFNSNEDIDQSWAVYFGSQRIRSFTNPVKWYNETMGDYMTIDMAFSAFAQIRV